MLFLVRVDNLQTVGVFGLHEPDVPTHVIRKVFFNLLGSSWRDQDNDSEAFTYGFANQEPERSKLV